MTRRGWCPTVHEPMASGDGLLVRVKPPGGVLTGAQATALADSAARHGNGAIELTNRGNVQLRGLTAASAARCAARMVAAGLASADPAAERRRNVIVAPLADAATRAVAAALEAALVADAALAMLPAKYGFAVSDAASLPLDGVRGEVRLHRARDGWTVGPDGGAPVACADPVAAALGMAHAGLQSNASPRHARSPTVIGVLHGAFGHGAFGAGLPFGATDAATLAALAAGCARIEPTPWRAIILHGAGMARLAESLGLIVDPADPRRAVTACAGRPACAAGRADTRADAGRLAALRPGLAVHLSGCAKGCAHPGPAALTLVAGTGGYALVRDGRAGDSPVCTGLSLEQAASQLA